MNPNGSRSGRSRALRIAVDLLLVPLWAVIAFICINSFESYTEVGDLGALTLIMLFAMFAWWYAEDRDRRRAAEQAAGGRDGDSGASADGDGYSPPGTAGDGHSPPGTAAGDGPMPHAA